MSVSDRLFWRQVASVLTGSTIAQIIPIFGSLIIARIYAPTDFGKYAAWLGFISIASVLLTCRLETSFSIESDGRAKKIAVLATTLVASIVSILIFFALFVFHSWTADFVDSNLMVLLVPAGFFIAIVQIWQSLHAANGSYRELSYARVFQAAALTVLQIFVGVFYSSAYSLALTHLVSSIATAIFLLCRTPLCLNYSRGTFFDCYFFLQKSYKTVVFALPASLANTVSSQLPVLIISQRFGEDTAGYYALANRVLAAPTALIAKSVIDVFKRHASIAYLKTGQCREEYIRAFYPLFGFSIFLFALIYFLAEKAFVFAYGADWIQAGAISSTMALLIAVRFVASPLSYMTYIAEKQHIDLIWQLALLVAVSFSLGFFNDFQFSLEVYVFSYGVLYLIYVMLSYSYSLGNRKHSRWQ